MDTFKAYAQANIPGRDHSVTDQSISELISELKQFNITTINEIDRFVKKHAKAFADEEKTSKPVSWKFNKVGVIRRSFKLENP